MVNEFSYSGMQIGFIKKMGVAPMLNGLFSQVVCICLSVSMCSRF